MSKYEYQPETFDLNVIIHSDDDLSAFVHVLLYSPLPNGEPKRSIEVDDDGGMRITTLTGRLGETRHIRNTVTISPEVVAEIVDAHNQAVFERAEARACAKAGCNGDHSNIILSNN